MAMRFNPYQQRMPSFRRPPPFDPFQQTRDPRGFRGGSRRRPNPFMNRGIGGFGGMFGGRGQRRRPPPRGRFPQSFGGFGGRGRGGMFGGFPQSRGRGRQSPFSNLFGGIGGFGGRRQFNPFMNQFGGGGFNISGGGFNPFMNRFGGGGFNPFARFGGRDPLNTMPMMQPPSEEELEALKKKYPSTAPPTIENPIMGKTILQEAPTGIEEMTPMETTAPVMPTVKPPTIMEQTETMGPGGVMPPALPTVGPPGTTITPAAPQDQIDTQPLTRQLGPNVPEGFIPPSGPSTSALVKYWNPTTGETWTASSGGWTAPEGWERAPLPTLNPFDFNQPPPATKPELLPNLVTGELERPTPSPQPLPMQPLPIGQQPLLPSMPVAPTLPVNIAQENIEREIIPPQLPVSPMQQATPNTLRAQDREPGFTQADYMRPQMTGTPATAFPSLLPHQQFAPTNMMGEPQKKALRDILKGSFGFGGL